VRTAWCELAVRTQTCSDALIPGAIRHFLSATPECWNAWDLIVHLRGLLWRLYYYTIGRTLRAQTAAPGAPRAHTPRVRAAPCARRRCRALSLRPRSPTRTRPRRRARAAPRGSARAPGAGAPGASLTVVTNSPPRPTPRARPPRRRRGRTARRRLRTRNVPSLECDMAERQ
jgi:hypothetical protein